MKRLLPIVVLVSLTSYAQDDSGLDNLEPPEPEPVRSGLHTIWTASLSQWGQAGDSSTSHQTSLSASWTAKWSAFKVTPAVRVVRSWQTSPDSSWTELEPSAKLRVALGANGAITASGWATTLQEPRDIGGSLKLSGTMAPWTGGSLEAWALAQDSREARAEGGGGTSVGQELTDRLAISASAGVWASRQVFPSGKTDESYSPEWNVGSGISWEEDSWSLAASGGWTWYEVEREVKINRRLLAARATATEAVRHDDWLVSLDASWDPSEALGLWSRLSWSWAEESGSVDLTRNATGKKKELSPTNLAIVQDGPSWEVGASWTW